MKTRRHSLLMITIISFALLAHSCNSENNGSKKSPAGKNNIDSCAIAKPFENAESIESMVVPGYTGVLNNYWGDDSTKLDFQHYFEKGKMVKSLFYYESGKVQEEYAYKCGSLHGPQKYYYENGRLARMIPYCYGYRQGMAEEYDENGRLRTQVFFKADSLTGERKTYNEKGELIE